jgi:hypothetical protein
MTVVVGYADGETVWIGADSIGVRRGYATNPLGCKAFVKFTPVSNTPVVFGYSGSFRLGQLLWAAPSVPDVNDGEDEMLWAVTTFIPWLRQLCTDNNVNPGSNTNDIGEVFFLFGINGRLFHVQSDLAVLEYEKYAIGAGEEFAIGAMHALSKFEISPEEMIEAAIDAASEYCAYVQGPVVVVSTDVEPDVQFIALSE